MGDSRLHVCTDVPFVLGDVGPIARKDGVDALLSVLDCNAEVPVAVLLPVSDRHLLLGQRAPGAVFVDVERINLASVELSRDFFVAARNTERERAYVRNLGRRAAFMTREEMKADAREGFVKLWHSGAEPA
jgi:hypothetical protein